MLWDFPTFWEWKLPKTMLDMINEKDEKKSIHKNWVNIEFKSCYPRRHLLSRTNYKLNLEWTYFTDSLIEMLWFWFWNNKKYPFLIICSRSSDWSQTSFDRRRILFASKRRNSWQLRSYTYHARRYRRSSNNRFK